MVNDYGKNFKIKTLNMDTMWQDRVSHLNHKNL